MCSSTVAPARSTCVSERSSGFVELRVEDDGTGDVHIRPGGGLAGLGDRLSVGGRKSRLPATGATGNRGRGPATCSAARLTSPRYFRRAPTRVESLDGRRRRAVRRHRRTRRRTRSMVAHVLGVRAGAGLGPRRRGRGGRVRRSGRRPSAACARRRHRRADLRRPRVGRAERSPDIPGARNRAGRRIAAGRRDVLGTE